MLSERNFMFLLRLISLTKIFRKGTYTLLWNTARYFSKFFMSYCSKVAKFSSLEPKQIRNSVKISWHILNTYLSEHLFMVIFVFLLIMSEKKNNLKLFNMWFNKFVPILKLIFKNISFQLLKCFSPIWILIIMFFR